MSGVYHLSILTKSQHNNNKIVPTQKSKPQDRPNRL
jgi:hypothetical protein